MYNKYITFPQKIVKKLEFLYFVYKCQISAKTQQNFASLHNGMTATFRSSAVNLLLHGPININLWSIFRQNNFLGPGGMKVG